MLAGQRGHGSAEYGYPVTADTIFVVLLVDIVVKLFLFCETFLQFLVHAHRFLLTTRRLGEDIRADIVGARLSTLSVDALAFHLYATLSEDIQHRLRRYACFSCNSFLIQVVLRVESYDLILDLWGYLVSSMEVRYKRPTLGPSSGPHLDTLVFEYLTDILGR